MSAFKQFLASDIIVTPFEVNKGFSFSGNELTGSNVEINRFEGQNIGGLFNPSTDPTTGYDNSQYKRLVYDSVRELYYSNYLSSSYGDAVQLRVLIPGRDTEGDRYVGSTQSEGRYFNYLQSTLTFERYFPTASNSIVGVISIPSRLYGNYIQPNSFFFSAESGSVIDDGEGNILYSGSNTIVGNIFYDHGLVVLTQNPISGATYGFATYGSSTYGGVGGADLIDNLIASHNATCSFSSSLNIFETQYKCTLRENEFNFSLNPSLISGSTDGTAYYFVTGSYFSPYVTTVGLYDEDQNLLAVGKLSQPLPTSPTTDTTILINIDR